MPKKLMCRGLLAVLPFLLLSDRASANLATPSIPTDRDQKRIVEAYGQPPLSFEANQGQTDRQVKFLARGNGYNLFLTPREAVLSLRKTEEDDLAATARRYSGPNADRFVIGPRAKPTTSVLRMKLLGANRRSKVIGQDQLPGKSNYFIGNDHSKWRTNIARYARVKYEHAYPGIDLVYYGNQRQLEYDFIVAPGADPKIIKLGFQGATKTSIDAQGNLVLHTPGGRVIQQAPLIYQDIRGQRQTVAGRYALRPARKTKSAVTHYEVGFRVAAYDRRHPLVIDPVLVYSTYLGGGGYDTGAATAVDSAGNAYVTGHTASGNFPAQGGLQTAPGGDYDAFVTKIDPMGVLIYSTFLGGNGYEHGRDIAVDNSGNAYVSGTTESYNFPTRNAFQPAYGGGFYDGFVAKLNASGAALVYSTYLGGNDTDYYTRIAIDTAGRAYVTGSTTSGNFPLHNPIQATSYGSGGYDGFVTRLSASGSTLEYSTYLAGSSSEQDFDIAVDGSGNAYISGYTESSDFPLRNAIQAAHAGSRDGFVTKLNAAGSALVYSTFLGGSGYDICYGIAVDATGNAYVTGVTDSSDFPTHSSLQAASGGQDAFVAKVNAAGTGLVYATYLGGSSGEISYAIAVDTASNAYVAGYTGSTDFPVAGLLRPAFGGYSDVFVTKLNAAGSALVYSTYFGGSNSEGAYGIAVDSLGNAIVTGYTYSSNYPTQNALQAVSGGANPLQSPPPPLLPGYDNSGNGGPSDGFVTKLLLEVDPNAPPTVPTPTPAPTPGPTPAVAQVDNLIRKAGEAAYVGNNIYNANGSGQSKRQFVAAGARAVYHVQVQNDGSVSNSFRVSAWESGTGWSVRYYDALSGGNDITLQVQNGTWMTPVLMPGAACVLRVEVTAGSALQECAWLDVLVQAATLDGATSDVVRATTQIGTGVPEAPTGLYAISTGSGKITLYWEGVAGATGYNVYRRVSTGAVASTAPVNGDTPVGEISYPGGSTYMFTDSGLTNGVEYFYTVRAVRSCAESASSNEDSDVVDPEGIPWDTRDPERILSKAAELAEAGGSEQYFDIEDEFTVMGPDGAIYERGIDTQQPPSGTFDETGRFTLRNGTSIALTGGVDPSDGGGDTSGSIGTRDIGRNVRTGAYRGARTFQGYRMCQFSVTLSPTVNLVGRSDPSYARLDDTAFVYLGSSAPQVGVDFGLIYDGSSDNKWHMYGLVSSPPLKRPLYSNTTFDPGTRVRMEYYVQLEPVIPGTKKRMVFLIATDTSGTGKSARIGAPAMNHHDGSKIMMKRNQQIAQRTVGQEQERGYVKSGSYMLDFNWQSGFVWRSNDNVGHRWSLTDTVIAKSYPEPSVDSVVTTNVLSKYDWEAHVGIDLRPY